MNQFLRKNSLFISTNLWRDFNPHGSRPKTSMSDEVQEVLFVAIAIDFTPDTSYVDELMFVIRYVKPGRQPSETFFGFIHIRKSTWKMQYWKFCPCAGVQIYMSDVYAELRANILDMSPNAFYVPCIIDS